MTDQQPTEIRHPLDIVASPDEQPAPTDNREENQ